MDFIGWYARESKRRVGVPLNDAYNQYLAYHEGWGGYRSGSYAGRGKESLRTIAQRVANNTAAYQVQLDGCEKRFRRGIPLVPFI